MVAMIATGGNLVTSNPALDNAPPPDGLLVAPLSSIMRRPIVSPSKVVVQPATPIPLPPPNNFGFSAGELVWMNDVQQARQLDNMKSTGVGWVRIDMEWYVVQPSSTSTYDWSAYDRAIDAIHQHSLKALVILDYAPAWAAIDGCKPSSRHQCAPADPMAFAAYAAAATARYTSDGVTCWEIWNEPNAQRFWYPGANAAAYAELLKVTYLAIKQINPNATVITGGLASTVSRGTIASPDYMAAFYQAGAEPYFDAIGAHPYSYPLLPTNSAEWNGWTQMLKMRAIAVAQGDATKKIWMTEVGASSGGPHPVSEGLQAQNVEEAVSLHNSYPWAGPLFWYNYQDLGTNRSVSTDFFGLVRADGSPKPAYTTFVQAIR